MGPELLYLILGIVMTVYAPDAKELVCQPQPAAIVQPVQPEAQNGN